MTRREPYFCITDRKAIDAIEWMRRWDFDLVRDLGYLALKMSITNDQARGLVKRGLELQSYPETRKQVLHGAAE